MADAWCAPGVVCGLPVLIVAVTVLVLSPGVSVVAALLVTSTVAVPPGARAVCRVQVMVWVPTQDHVPVTFAKVESVKPAGWTSVRTTEPAGAVAEPLFVVESRHVMAPGPPDVSIGWLLNPLTGLVLLTARSTQVSVVPFGDVTSLLASVVSPRVLLGSMRNVLAGSEVQLVVVPLIWMVAVWPAVSEPPLQVTTPEANEQLKPFDASALVNAKLLGRVPVAGSRTVMLLKLAPVAVTFNVYVIVEVPPASVAGWDFVPERSPATGVLVMVGVNVMVGVDVMVGVTVAAHAATATLVVFDVCGVWPPEKRFAVLEIDPPPTTQLGPV
jgi:hypothetical protein